MRTLGLIIGLVMSSMMLSGQSLSDAAFGEYADLSKFYQGCLKIREGEKTGDLAAYEDAMTLLKEKRGFSRKGLNLSALDVVPVDTLAQASIDNRVEFSYSYAKAKAEMTPFRPDGVLRKVATVCRIKNIAIKPGGKVVYRDDVERDCILLAVAAEPDARIRVSVTDADQKREGEVYENGAVGFVRWTQSERSEVGYVIENLSDETVSVVIAAN